MAAPPWKDPRCQVNVNGFYKYTTMMTWTWLHTKTNTATCVWLHFSQQVGRTHWTFKAQMHLYRHSPFTPHSAAGDSEASWIPGLIKSASQCSGVYFFFLTHFPLFFSFSFSGAGGQDSDLATFTKAICWSWQSWRMYADYFITKLWKWTEYQVQFAV